MGTRTRLILLACVSLPACRAPVIPVSSPPSLLSVDTSGLAAFGDSVANGAFGFIDGILVVRDGRTVFQRGFSRSYEAAYPMTEEPGIWNYHDAKWHPFYQGSSLHTLQSVTKSVTSIIFGIAVDRGDIVSIDQRIEQFLPAYARYFSDDRKKQITIRHLLTMTSGIRWPEDGTYDNDENITARMEKSRDWPDIVLAQPMEATPGQRWNYSSGGAALLAAIFQAATKRDIQDYAAEHLFTPIGIQRFYWKRSAGGLTDTEGGLYLDIGDLVKIGQLYLNRGEWSGRRIVSERWVNESVVPFSNRPEDRRNGRFAYGRLWWNLPAGTATDPSAFFAWGYGGQYLLVLPRWRTVAAITGWNLDKRPVLPDDFARRVEQTVRP